MSSVDKAIGGYFELEIPQLDSFPYADAFRYQSARSAYYALLKAGRPSKVWMPRYICDSMLMPLNKAGIEICFYSINVDLSIKEDITLRGDEWLFYVNYFGVCSGHQLNILERFNAEQVIFDHSQAFFTPPFDCLATIYSPRKFFGVPDGGLLFTKLEITEPKEIDSTSIDRTVHLLKRLADTPEGGYANYQAAEKMLEEVEPKRMSALTERLLASIDYVRVKSQRFNNFKYIDSELKLSNSLLLDVKEGEAPLCYPFISKEKNIRKELLKDRVFVPVYWQDCVSRIFPDSAESGFISQLYPLPCDQRYEEVQLFRMIQIIKLRVNNG